MLKLWGRISSINVRKVVLCLQELGLPFERIDAGASYGITTTPAYLAHNPNALVPLLDDQGYTLWESNVIVRYLCAAHARQPASDADADAGADALYPADLRTRFDAERWMDWQQTTMNPAGRDAFVQLIRKPDGRVDALKVAASVAAMQALLDRLDQHLATRPYVAGGRYTMADIPLSCELHRWRSLPLPPSDRLQGRPHLDAWYQRVQGRPSARGVLDLALS